jgi:exopolyphosphatase/guanosine-5'-triphosphate,3'-diphosphate pyrophosphatase
VKRKKIARAEPPKYQPVGIVDIGSNSVRLVVYDGPNRAPAPIFNEKIACGLGRGLAISGRLGDEAIERTLRALSRFQLLCEQMGTHKIHAVATAASREAVNGPEFIERAEEALGHRIEILSGKQEATYAAMGVLSGIPDADGVVGDLGGGSLELIEVKDGRITDGLTVPLGALRLMDTSGNSIARARKFIDETLAGLEILDRLKGRSFYSVGGTWRNLARLHMAQTMYPLQVLHQYKISRTAARSLASLVSGLSADTVREIPSIQKARAETLPYGALVLDRLLKRARAKDVVVSAFGLREGLIFSKLEKHKRKRDPLLVACADFARRYARSPDHEYELCEWTNQLFGPGGLKETPEQTRLRHASCFLADIGWRTHPNYRGERSLSLISQASFAGIDHPGRIFLALTTFFRYEGPLSDRAPQELMRLIDKNDIPRARLISAAQRLAYVMSGAMPGMLPQIRLSFEGPKSLVLTVPESLQALLGERVDKTLGELAQLAGRTPAVKVARR